MKTLVDITALAQERYPLPEQERERAAFIDGFMTADPSKVLRSPDRKRIKFGDRFARAHGLKKTPQFQRKCLEATTKAAALSHWRNGTYPPKGFQIPGAELHRFQKGVTPEQRLGRKGNEERIRKSAQSRRETWKLEHARALFGLPRETKLNVVRHPREHAVQRYALKKHGYVVDRGGYDCGYGPETRRSARLETRPFRFYEIQN